MFGITRGVAGVARVAGGVLRGPAMAANAKPVSPIVPHGGALHHQLDAKRNYRHWWRVLPEDFELNTESMPKDVKTLMASN
eukprot:CAMPEP_0117485898 /NCGR_PEP_ID=MMETSP0784-20121206/15201_1 /TAXON_ID=39447 /ORGANISM="" /LENGTH=80 /DNA_ID=CAMNT_0005280497 /DNA_START=73 /DNA_END=312 /DNA_ORIENTATION=-